MLKSKVLTATPVDGQWYISWDTSDGYINELVKRVAFETAFEYLNADQIGIYYTYFGEKYNPETCTLTATEEIYTEWIPKTTWMQIKPSEVGFFVIHYFYKNRSKVNGIFLSSKEQADEFVKRIEMQVVFARLKQSEYV